MFHLDEVLILYTDWAADYWETDKTAPYPKRSIENIRHLKHSKEIPAIGIYTKGKKADLSHISPCFLVIKNVEENEKGEPLFQFHFVQKITNISSATLESKIGKPNLFFSRPKEEIVNILFNYGINLTPTEWNTQQNEWLGPPWQSWIGERFLSIQKSVSSAEYEDRTTEILRALGFTVDQMGHKKEGEFPDGIAYSTDYSIVYDCKNAETTSLMRKTSEP